MPRGRPRSDSEEVGAVPTYHQAGSKVMALWPGSGLYYPAVINRGLPGNRYDVEFEDSSTFALAAANVLAVSSTRRRSRSRSRSPGRRRSRSPGRARKSPTRAPKSPKKARPALQAAPVDLSASDSPLMERTVRRSTRSTGQPAPAQTVDDLTKSSESSESASLALTQPETSNIGTETKSAISPTLSPAEDSGSNNMSSSATATTDGGTSPQPEKPPAKTNFEFGGPVGALMTIISLPAVIIALYSVCSPRTCSISDVLSTKPPQLQSLLDVKAVAVVVAWLAFHAVLYCLPLGSVTWGRPLRDGSRLPYRISAFHTFLITGALFLGSVFYGDRFNLRIDPVYVYNNFLQLAIASVAVSAVVSVFLYAYSFRQGAMLAEGGNTGNHVYDFFIGRELNPRIGKMFDLKIFGELRPGLIAWVTINFCLAYTQYAKHGYVSNSMLMVNIFQFLYVVDGIFSEAALLSTMDIISDGFGYMLAFGDFAWVPFTYTLQARYLVDRPTQLPTWAVAFLIGLNMLGFYIFRTANSQKDQFRRSPTSPGVAHLYTISTSSGRLLLADGWWGICRKPNYLGDLMMALAWCGTCGAENIICYFYFIYFAILLIHRQRRDDLHCARKYGDAWKEYMRRVPYKIVPGIY